MTVVDPDGHRSASVLNLADHLTGVLAAGAAHRRIGLDAGATAIVTWEREPLLLLTLERDLMLEELRAEIDLADREEDGEPTLHTTTLRFAPFSERGAMLPIWPLAPLPRFSELVVAVRLTSTRETGAAAELDARDVAGSVALTLVQGLTGTLLHLCAAEKAAIRRAAREVAAARVLGTARRGSLDRHGADLGVARFTDLLIGTAAEGAPPQVSTRPRDGGEPDPDYRRRLAAMRSFSLANPAGVREAVNGEGSQDDPPRGWLSELAGAQRVRLIEEVRPFSVGMLLLSVGRDQQAAAAARTTFLAGVRQERLVVVADLAGATDAYRDRLLTSDQRAALVELSTDLHAGYRVAGSPPPALAPPLARCLQKFARYRAELGSTGAWTVVRGQDPAAGSPYELGLAADLKPGADPEPELAGLLRDWTPTAGTPPDIGIALAAAQRDTLAGVSPTAAVLAAAGARTYRERAGSWTVSHLALVDIAVTAGGQDVVPGGPTHVASFGWMPADAALQLVLTADADAGTVRVLSLDRRGAPTVVAESTAAAPALPAGADGIAVLREPRPADPTRVGRVVAGYRARPDAEPPRGAEVQLVTVNRSLEGNVTLSTPVVRDGLPDWTQLAPLRWGDAAALALHDRARSSLTVVCVDGQAARASVEGIGRWTHLFALPAPSGTGGDDVACYDVGSGDLQVLAVGSHDAERPEIRVRWRQAGWRPGLDLLTPLPGGRVLAVDRDLGRVEEWSGLADGVPTRTAEHGIGPRNVTHVVGLPAATITGPDGVVLAYDRSRGRAVLWPGVGPQAPVPPPMIPWSANPVAVPLTASLATHNGTATFTAAVQGVADAWQALGHAAVDVAVGTAQYDAWKPGAVPGLEKVFAGIGITVAGANPGFVDNAKKVPVAEVATIFVEPVVGAAWMGGGRPDLARELLRALSVPGIASAVVVRSSRDGQPAIVVSSRSLPGAGYNISGRRTSDIRWEAFPLTGTPAAVTGSGERATAWPAGNGMSLLVAIGYHSSELADPYQVRLDLPGDGRLTLEQYEFLLNVVERAVPAGIEANTFALRRRRLDVDGDGSVDPLPVATARVFRRFRSGTRRGQPGPG
ncbi:MAG TPA: hypothetical protein VFG13_09710 [Blastococcus sp.]|nr:hypothetical protein [Blastococcus sp.]